MPETLSHNQVLPKWVHVLIAAVLLFVLTAPFLELDAEAGLVVALFLFITLAILTLLYKKTLLFLLVALVPLSVPFTVVGTSKLSFPSELICVFLTLLFFGKLLVQRKIDYKLLKHPVSLMLIADVLWLLLASSFSQMPEVSLKRVIIRVLYGICFYYWMLELFLNNLNSIKSIVLIYFAALLIPIAYTVYRHFQIDFMMIGSQQLSAPFYFDHTIYGAALVFFFPFLIYLLAQKQISNKITLPLLLIITLASFLSFSRAAWLSLVVALAFYPVLHYKVKPKIIGSVILLAALLFLFNTRTLFNSAENTKEQSHTNDVGMHLKSVSNISTDASNKERINRWKCALRMFADKPVFGFGPGTYQFFYGPYQVRTELTRISTFSGNKGHAHSEYLNYMSETGLPGLLIFCGLLFFAAKTALRNIYSVDAHRTLSIALFCSLLTFVIHAFFNGFLEFDKIALPVFSSMAAIVAIDIKSKQTC